jgi:hypothetical protein
MSITFFSNNERPPKFLSSKMGFNQQDWWFNGTYSIAMYSWFMIAKLGRITPISGLDLWSLKHVITIFRWGRKPTNIRCAGSTFSGLHELSCHNDPIHGGWLTTFPGKTRRPRRKQIGRHITYCGVISALLFYPHIMDLYLHFIIYKLTQCNR